MKKIIYSVQGGLRVRTDVQGNALKYTSKFNKNFFLISSSGFMEMGYKYFSSSFWHNLAHALLQGRVRSIWGLLCKLSLSHSYVPRESGTNWPHSVLIGKSTPEELKQGLPSKKEPHEQRCGTSCPHPPRGQHAIINACMIAVYNCWSWYFIFTMINFFKQLPNSLVPLHRGVCLLHLYVTSYLILWTIKFSLQQIFVAKTFALDK